MIGYRFMGKAHSNAWRQAPHFFPLKAEVEMSTICGRDPKSVRRSLMTSPVFAPNEAVLRDKLAGQDVDALRARGRIIGTAPQIAGQLHALSVAGLDRVMLRWENLDDPEGLRALGAALLPLL